MPAPVHEGKASIRHLAQLLTWLRDVKRYRVEDDLLALAEANMQVNIAVEERNLDADTQKRIRSVFA